MIAVLIPCYNEASSIGGVIKEYKEALPESVIYVYDNNSTDGTDKVAREAGAIVKYERRQGKGNVVRSMFRDIDASCYVLVDGDGTYPASLIRNMVDMVLLGEADMVVGDRLSTTYSTENHRRFHDFGNRLVRTAINTLWKSDVKDVMSGLRVFSPVFVKSFPIISKGFELETEMTIYALDRNLLIENVPIEYKDRQNGESKLNTFEDGAKVILSILRLCRDYKPLYFFSSIAIMGLLISFIMFLPVFEGYMITGTVAKFPTLIVSSIIAVISCLFFTAGLILESIACQSRRQDEINMNLIRKIFDA